MKNKIIRMNSLAFSNDLPFVLIAGPDSLESLEHAMFIAKKIKEVITELGIPYVFKASYDKANRTSINSFRGVGLQKGIEIFNAIRKELNIPITTDVHSKEEAKEIGKVVDIVQVPALLSRQTDILVAAGLTKKIVNVKKGQFIAPYNVNSIISKIEFTGNKNILVTERGTTFGYNDIVADMRSLEIMKRFTYPIIFDASHTVQLPSSMKNKSGGDRSLISVLAKAAIAVGVAGIFIEVHDNPDKAPVDGLSSLSLKDLKSLLITLKKIDYIVKK